VLYDYDIGICLDLCVTYSFYVNKKVDMSICSLAIKLWSVD